MRIADYIEQSFTNLRKTKLRTFLTTFGIVIGIGALVSMVGFAEGMKKNITDTFEEMGLFNYITVYPAGGGPMAGDPDAPGMRFGVKSKKKVEIDEQMLEKIRQIDGVEWAFVEVRFPAMIDFNDNQNFTYVQALPAEACKSGLVKLKEGEVFETDDANSLVISQSFLRILDSNSPKDLIGKQIEVATLTIDINSVNPAMIPSIMSGTTNPFITETYTFTIVGVSEQVNFGGPGMLRSDVLIPIETSERMKKLSATSIEDFFETEEKEKTYPSVRVKVSDVEKVYQVKDKIKELGLFTFAFVDILKGMKIGFMLLDMFLFGIGMIAITVASLGIVNTMVMSIMERYREIGIMKAIGAGDDDVMKIIFFETATIGFMGGVFGLVLGWCVSVVINFVVNQIISRQGAPFVNCFNFPWWLCLGAIGFSMLVSLAAGIYPAFRAAKVDPVVALRHD